MFKRILFCIALCSLWTLPALAQSESDAQRAIAIAEADEAIAGNLALYPDYEVETWMIEEDNEEKEFIVEAGWYEVEFFAPRADDEEDYIFLGWALVDVANEEIVERWAPLVLSEEEFAVLEPQVIELALEQLQLQMVVTDPDDWEIYVETNGEGFEVSFYRGTDLWIVEIYYKENAEDEETFFVGALFNGNALSEEEADRSARDAAITIAWEDPSIDALIVDEDTEWFTYVQPFAENQYTVEFATETTILHCVVVDITTERVVQSC